MRRCYVSQRHLMTLCSLKVDEGYGGADAAQFAGCRVRVGVLVIAIASIFPSPLSAAMRSCP